MPITWRNVGATIGANDAARLFRGANDSIMGGLDRLRGAVGTVEKGREDQHKFKVDKNTDAFMDAVNQYKSPEELQAAQESGALDKLYSSFGNAINKDVTRNAAEQRLTTLRNQDIAGAQHELTTGELTDDKLSRAAQPTINKIDTMIARRDFAGARETLDTDSAAIDASGDTDDLWAKLISAEESVQDRNTRIADENLARQDQAAARKTAAENRERNASIYQAADIRANAVNNTPDGSAMARQQYLERAEAWNANNPDRKLSTDVINAELDNIEEEWRDRWGITESQDQEIQAHARQLDEVVAQNTAREQDAMAELDRQNADNKKFAWNDDERTTPGDARREWFYGVDGDSETILTQDTDEIDLIQDLVEKEIKLLYEPKRTVEVSDNSGGLTSLLSPTGFAPRTRTETISNPNYDATREWGVEAQEHMGDIMLEVGKRLNPESGSLERMDGVDLEQYGPGIARVVQEVVAEFQSSKRKADLIRQARNESRMRVNTIRNSVNTLKQTKLDEYRELNRAMGSQ